MKKIDPLVEQVQVHIIAGCSDGRDISSVFNEAREEVIDSKKSQKVLVDMQRLSIPGVFATSEVIGEIKTTLFGKENEYFHYRNSGKDVSFFVHMMAHGNAVLKEGRDRSTFNYHDIEIMHSDFNCGMTGAQKLAKEFEALLLAEKPTIHFRVDGRKQEIQIVDESSIEKFMMEAHGFNGTIAGNWIKSIVDLSMHPYEQKKILRTALHADSATRKLGVHITAGVQNYGTSEYFRVDGNTHLITVVDEIYEKIRERGVPEEEKKKRTDKQKPKILLFHHGDIENARARSIEEYSGGGPYSGGDAFAVAGINAADHSREFGPYKTDGFYYAMAPNHLNLAKDFVVAGRTKDETKKMVARLHNSGLVKTMINLFDAKIHPMVLPAKPPARKIVVLR